MVLDWHLPKSQADFLTMEPVNDDSPVVELNPIIVFSQEMTHTQNLFWGHFGLLGYSNYVHKLTIPSFDYPLQECCYG